MGLGSPGLPPVFGSSLIQGILLLLLLLARLGLFFRQAFSAPWYQRLLEPQDHPLSRKGPIFFHSFGEKIPGGLQLAGLSHVPISEPITVAAGMEAPSPGACAAGNVLPTGKSAGI